MIDEEFNITIDARADFVLTLTVRDTDGNLMNLSGCTITGQLREFPEATDYFDFTITNNGSGGQILVKMSHETTERIGFTYGVYDIFLRKNSQNLIEKIIHGKAKIIPAVTRIASQFML